MPTALLVALIVLLSGPAAFALWLAACRVVPALIGPSWRLLLRTAYRFRVSNADRVPKSGGVLLVVNHTSYLDWMILWAACPRRVGYVLWSGYYENPVLRFFLGYVRDRAVRIDNRSGRPRAVVEALDAVAAALDRGEAVVIYPEGRLTRNGQVMPFGRGIERILRTAKTPVAVVPVGIAGMWGSVFSHKRPPAWFGPDGVRRVVAVNFGEPLPQTVNAGEARAAVVEALADATIRGSGGERLVHSGYVRTATRWHRFFRIGHVDNATGTERLLSFGRGFVAAWCLRSWLKSRVGRDGPPVGVWLPTGLGSFLANTALGLLRRTTVNLNYTAGPASVNSAAEQVGMTHVVTSKRFAAKIPLDLPPEITRLYLEDALPSFTPFTKIWRFAAALLLPGWLLVRLLGLHRTKPDDVLTIVFSSGSTGEPKGVMLSHRNISANLHAFRRGVELYPSDRLLAALPFFHSFGYTICLWMPANLGMAAIYQADPRAAKDVGTLCAKHACTLFLGTATFLRLYLRRCEPTDFRTLRLLICGAEKLPPKLAGEFHAKFGVFPLEGYGCTELSPVVSANLPDVTRKGVTLEANRIGTVGRPLPGIAVAAFDSDTRTRLPVGTEGVLGVKGANVMFGYFGKPEQSAAAVRHGWYVTGDFGVVDAEGFVRITGRLSRFAKIAGEMIPLEKLEDEAHEQLDSADRLLAAAAVPCESRGERVVFLYLPVLADRLEALLKELPKRGVPNLWVPDRRDCYPVESFPVLGSGKLDLKAVGELAAATAAAKKTGA